MFWCKIFIFFLANTIQNNTLGIDFGSEFFKAAYLIPGRQLTSVEDQMSSKLIDAVLVFCDYNIYFEYKARQKQYQTQCDSFSDLHMLIQNSTIEQFEQLGYKKLKQDDIGILFPIRKENIRLNETERYLDDEFYYLRQEEILALMFQRIQKYSQQNSGVKIKSISLTLPSNQLNIQTRMKILSALKITELQPKTFLSQNSAGVFYYVFQNTKIEKKQTQFLIVLNIGYSGTMISLVKIFFLERQLKNKKLEYIPTIQVQNELFSEEFSGKIIDKCILDYILQQQQNKDITLQQKQKLLQKIKKQKKVLSVNNEVKIDLKDIQKETKPFTLRKQDFEKQCEDTFFVFENILQKFKQNIDSETLKKIRNIEIIGGITRIPKVKEIIEKIFTQKPSNHIDGNFAPSFGAALSAVKYTDGIKTKEIILQENPIYEILFEIEKDDEIKKVVLFDQKSIKRRRVITLKDLKKNFNFLIKVESQNYEIEYRIKGVSQFIEKNHDKKIIETKTILVFVLNEFGIIEFESVKMQLVEQYTKKIQKKEFTKTKNHDKKLSYVIKSQSYQPLFSIIEQKKISIKRLLAIKQLEIYDMQFSQQKSSLENTCNQTKQILDEKVQYLVEEEKQDLNQKQQDCDNLVGLKIIDVNNIVQNSFKYMKIQDEVKEKNFNEKQKLIIAEMKKLQKILQKQIEILNTRIIQEKKEKGVVEYAQRVIQEFQDFVETLQNKNQLLQHYNDKYKEQSQRQIKLIQKLINQNEKRKINEPQILTYDSIGKNHEILEDIMENINKLEKDQINKEEL